MAQVATYSKMLSQLGNRLPGDLKQSQPMQTQPVVETPKAPAQNSIIDILELSSIRSRATGTTFGRGLSPISVNQNGTYRAPTQMMNFNRSVNFSFAASTSKATVVQRGISGGIETAQENSKYAYGAEAYSSQRLSGGTYSEVKRFQTDMFFSRTRTLSQRLSPETGQKLESTGGKVVRQFELEISLDVSFMRQFSTQTEGLADDEEMLNNYLDGAGGLADQSGDAMKAFFDEVDQILADTESFVKDSLGSFLLDVKTAFGMDNAEASAFHDAVVEEVSAFFEDVNTFLSEARQSMFNAASPEPALPPSETVPEIAAQQPTPEGVVADEVEAALV